MLHSQAIPRMLVAGFAGGLLLTLVACPGPTTQTATATDKVSRRPASSAPTGAGLASARPTASPLATLSPISRPSPLRTEAPVASASPGGPPATASPPSPPTTGVSQNLPVRPGQAGVVPTGALVVSTFSGGTDAAANPAGYQAGEATASRYGTLQGLAVDAADALYLCEGVQADALPGIGGVVRKIRPDGSSVVLGGDRPGPPRADFYSFNDTLAVTRFDTPLVPRVLSTGGLAILSEDLFTVRAIAPGGDISLVAWVALLETKQTSPYMMVPAGPLTHAPKGFAQDSAGNWYIGDAASHVIRKLSTEGRTTIFAGGTGTTPNPKGYLNGPAEVARFNEPYGLAFDAEGNLLVSDRVNGAIRRIAPDGAVTTFAGRATPTQGYRNGPAADAEFASPMGLAIDAAGAVFVAERDNHAIRRITPSGVVSTVAGGDDAGTTGAGFRNGPAAQARFDLPVAVAIDSKGALYVSDQRNHVIRKIHPGP